LFPAQDFQNQEAHDLFARTDLKSLATCLFRLNRCSDLAKLLITLLQGLAAGSLRGGEVKFCLVDECILMIILMSCLLNGFRRKL